MLPGPSGCHASSSVPLALLLDAVDVNGVEVVCGTAPPGRLKTGMAVTTAAGRFERRHAHRVAGRRALQPVELERFVGQIETRTGPVPGIGARDHPIARGLPRRAQRLLLRRGLTNEAAQRYEQHNAQGDRPHMGEKARTKMAGRYSHTGTPGFSAKSRRLGATGRRLSGITAHCERSPVDYVCRRLAGPAVSRPPKT